MTNLYIFHKPSERLPLFTKRTKKYRPYQGKIW